MVGSWVRSDREPKRGQRNSEPARTYAEPQPTAATGGGGTGATPDILDGAIFGMGKIDARKNVDPKAETSIVLEISITKRLHEDVDTDGLKVQVFFYDIVNNRDIKLTDAEVNYKWLTSRQWFEERPEILEVSYFRPRRSAASKNSRKYLGYIVRLYFNNKLQAVAADPTKLLNIFPPAPVMSPKASGSVTGIRKLKCGPVVCSAETTAWQAEVGSKAATAEGRKSEVGAF